MWIATIDFTKAFDSITHKSIWKAINSCGINHTFEIKKGTKQGDPLSTLLFNTVLQNSLKEVTQRWQKKRGMGIYLNDYDHDCLTNLRFVDDVLLFATSKEQLQKMMYEFKRSTDKVGLSIHPEKTKILSNQSSDTRTDIEIDDIKVEILTRGESTKCLGQMITFQQQEAIEIKNRIRTAWATFSQIQAGADIEELFAKTPSPTVRRSNNSDDMLRVGNMGTHQRA